MRPITVRTSARVAAPAADAWEFLSLYANDPLWRRGVTRMDQAPAGPVVDGASTDEELRMLGRTMTNVARISDVRDGESFAWRVSDGVDAHGSRRVVPTGEGSCEIVIDKEVHLAPADRLLRPVIAWVIRWTERGDTRRAARQIEERATNARRGS